MTEKEEVVEGAKVEERLRSEGYNHPLMSTDYKLNIMEVSHRDVEKIEKYRYKLIGDMELSDEETVSMFKEFVFSCLVKKENASGVSAKK